MKNGRRRIARIRFIITAVMIASIIAPRSGAEVEAIRHQAGHSMDYSFNLLRDASDYFSFDLSSNKKQDELTAQDRAARVTKLRLCPRRVLLYADETRTLVPLALDHTRRGEDGEAEVVHGAAIQWETDSEAVAEVTSYGEVTAISPGKTKITARAGSARASVLVEVKEGARPVESDFEYDPKHANDCEEPEAEDVKDSKQGATADSDRSTIASNREDKSKSPSVAPFKSTARLAAMKAQERSSAQMVRTSATTPAMFHHPLPITHHPLRCFRGRGRLTETARTPSQRRPRLSTTQWAIRDSARRKPLRAARLKPERTSEATTISSSPPCLGLAGAE